MPGIEIEVATGGIVPLVVPPTTVDFTVMPGGGALCGWSLRDIIGTQVGETSGTVTSPGAGATIASLAAPTAGTYKVTWTVALEGTPGVGDANNFQLLAGATLVATSINPGVQGNYIQVAAEVTVATGTTFFVKSVAAGTVGVTYAAQFEISTVGEGQSIVEIIDTPNVLAVVDFTTFRSNTEFLTDDGIVVSSGLVLHVVTGGVKGAIYAIPSSSSS